MIGQTMLVILLTLTIGGCSLFFFFVVEWPVWPLYCGLLCIQSKYSAQTVHSRFWDPGSEAVDIFTVSWRNENCWWAPLSI